MRKTPLRHIVAVVLILCISFCLTSCGSSSSLTGTWVVKEYRFGEETYSTNNVSEMMGEDFAANWNDSTITFSSRGDIEVHSMGVTNSGTYEVDGDEISIYDEDGNFQGNIRMVDETIEVDFDIYVMVYEKK